MPWNAMEPDRQDGTETFGPWLTTWPAEMPDGSVWEWESEAWTGGSMRRGMERMTAHDGCLVDDRGDVWTSDFFAPKNRGDRLRRVYPTGTAQGGTVETTCSNPFRIRVTRRSSDFHACIDGHPELWSCGSTPDAAIGACVRAHRDRLGIEIVEGYDDANL